MYTFTHLYYTLLIGTPNSPHSIMSGRRARRGRCSHGTVIGPAVYVSTGKCGRDQSSGWVLFPLYSDVAHSIQPQHAKEVVGFLTKPSLSSSSSMTQADTNGKSTTAARSAYSASLSTATPAIAPASCMGESAELFEHSIRHLLIDDAQTFT